MDTAPRLGHRTPLQAFIAALGVLPPSIIFELSKEPVEPMRILLRRDDGRRYAVFLTRYDCLLGVRLGRVLDDGTELVFTYDDCTDPAGIGTVVREHLLEGDIP